MLYTIIFLITSPAQKLKRGSYLVFVFNVFSMICFTQEYLKKKIFKSIKLFNYCYSFFIYKPATAPSNPYSQTKEKSFQDPAHLKRTVSKIINN